MFLKVKNTAGKKYFAICESVRRDNKVTTKTIKSLGNAEKAFLLLQNEYPEFLDRYKEIVGTKKCRDNSSALEIIKELVVKNGYSHLLKNETKICLSHVHNGIALCQITVVLLNDDVMTYLTIRKYDKPFVGWEITPKTNRKFDFHKKNQFERNENGLYTLAYRSVQSITEKFDEWLKGSD